MDDLKFKIELNVLNHLGLGLYSSTPAVVTEIISNAWDADAEEVNIVLAPTQDYIFVEDDGHGMSKSDVQNKFLKVGYSRRIKEQTGCFSKTKSRRVMGRKGIGKLAMFSLANEIEIVTKAEDSEPVAFRIDVGQLKQQITSAGEDEPVDYPVQPAPVPTDFTKPHGTRITLRSLNSNINKTEDFLRPRLARRFGVFGREFKVTLNGGDVTRKDAEFYNDIQFLWFFDEEAKNEIASLSGNIASFEDANGHRTICVESLNSTLVGENSIALTLKGFLATVDTPKKLGKGDESLNKVSIFANGRLFQEDILPELGDAKYFNSYLVGEVHADFLDQDEIDRATASREAIKHDDQKFQLLRNHLKRCMGQVSSTWDDWRRSLGYGKTGNVIPAVEQWLQSISDKRSRKLADRLMTSIANMSITNDESSNKEAQRLLFRSTIVGFEKLQVRNELEVLEGITDVLSPEFQAIFASLDDIEESYYADIVRSRLEVIRKFEEEIVDEEKRERVAQEYLFDHLWLLDPSWGRVSGSEVMELTLTEELKRACPDSEEGARLDIAYRTTTGRHVIIELKRPGLKVQANTLEAQGRKYVDAMEQYYIEHPNLLNLNGRTPPIDVYFLISERPSMNEKQERAFELYNMKILTYQGLITSARQAYQEYLSAHVPLGRIEQILTGI